MDRLDALTAFVAVADEGGFARAGRSLNLSAPAMTRAIAGLERHYGVALFHRSTRSVVLTPEGAALLEQARAVLQRLRDAEHALMGGGAEPRGELCVTAPVIFGRMHVLPVVAQMLEVHPALRVRMMLIDRNVRIVEEGIDVAVRIGPLDDSSLTCVKIGAVRQTIVCSPDYQARRGVPGCPEELAGHDVIAGDSARALGQWRFGTRGGEAVRVEPRLTVNSLDAVLAAVRAGLGLANVLSYQVREAVAQGELVAVLEDHALPPLPVHLVFPASRAALPAARVFVEAMRERGRAQAWG